MCCGIATRPTPRSQPGIPVLEPCFRVVQAVIPSTEAKLSQKAQAAFSIASGGIIAGSEGP